MKKIYLLWSILLLCFSHGIAQVSFQTKVSKNRLGLNERLRVSFEMNQNGDNFTPPSFNGFNVVGGPNQSVSNSLGQWGEKFFEILYLFSHANP